MPSSLPSQRRAGVLEHTLAITAPRDPKWVASPCSESGQQISLEPSLLSFVWAWTCHTTRVCLPFLQLCKKLTGYRTVSHFQILLLPDNWKISFPNVSKNLGTTIASFSSQMLWITAPGIDKPHFGCGEFEHWIYDTCFVLWHRHHCVPVKGRRK